MSANVNANVVSAGEVEGKTCGLDQPAAAATGVNTVVDCNGNGKDYVDHDPVIDQNSAADQVGQLEEDHKHTELESGLVDEIKKEQNFQQKEREREEKVVELVAGGVHEAEVASLSNAEDQDSQDTRVDVAKAEPNKSINDEKKVGEGGKLDSAIDIEENKDSQNVLINGSPCVVVNGVNDNLDLVTEKEPSESINSEDIIESKPNQSSNGLEKVEKENKLDLTVDTEENIDSQSVVINSVHNDLDLNQEKGQTELINDEDVAESKPNQSSNDEEKVEKESNMDSTVDTEENIDSKSVVINGVHSDLDLNQEKGQTELINDEDVAESKPHQSSNDEDKIDEERKLDSAVDIEENKDSQSVVMNGVHNDLDLDKKGQREFINDVPMEDSQKASVVSPEIREAESSEGHTQDSVAKTEIADDSVANQNDFVHTGQTTTEQNQPLEIATKMPSPVVHEDAPVESSENASDAPISHGMVVEPADRVEDSCSVENTKLCDTAQTEPEVDNVHANDSENVDSHSVDGTKEEIEAEKAPVVDHTTLSCPGSNVNPDTQTSSQNIESEEKVSTLSSSDVEVKSDVIEGVAGGAGTNSVSVDNSDRETSAHDSIEKKNHVPMLDVKAESEVENISTAPSEEMPDRNGFTSQNEVLNDSVDTIDNGADQHINKAADYKSCQEVEAIGVRGDEALTSTPEDEQNATAEVAKGPFYMIRVPRYDDNDIKEKIKHAQFKVDEKTKNRDAIRDQIQKKRASCREYDDVVEAAKSEERAARYSLKEKRKAIDSVQSKINRVRSAIDVEEIDSRIRKMEHMMQHETLPLKEEKQFIREIKQLKQVREQLSSNMSSEDQVQQDMNQKDQVEEHLKALQSLRKEADALRENVLKAEAATQSAKQRYSDVNDQLSDLLDQFRAADDIRQEAYAHLQSFRKQLHEKNKYFWKYKDDSTAATSLALKGDKEELQRHCVNQVERVMELWNNNDEFRKEYVRCNMRSTLRRLRTFDGRALGPDEQPPTIPIFVSQRVATDNIAPSAPALEAKKPVASVETEKIDAKSTPKVGEQKNQTAKAKKHPKPAALENGLPNVSGNDQIEESREEHKQRKEEEELARKAEELRMEKEAALLKEQRRLEEKAKAKEAMERKKRIADKAQARAALRAQKEAEEKEKEREKRARKKGKKNAATEDAKDINEGDSALSSETPSETKESETKEKPVTVTKKAQKPSQFAKQTKAKSVPLPLRNRGKRRMQTWMWVLIILLVVIALFLLGNSSFSFNFGLLRFGF